MEPTLQKLHVDASLDVRGAELPDGYLKAKAQLQTMAEQQILELYIDEGEALSRVPFALRAEGHEILVSELANRGVRLLVRKRAPLE